tara:strand:- start:558 stop:893 length:336 start_codon:yes stop_codon:yes gene_type:complete
MERLDQKVRNTILDLENRGYSKSVDAIGEYLKGADLYYKKVFDNNYVVFTHYNKDKKEWLQGFDCWISLYNSNKDIGRLKALSSDHIILSFDFNKDWTLVYQKIEEIEKLK